MISDAWHRKETIPERLIPDGNVVDAVSTIVYWAVQHAAAETTHHLHFLPFDNLTREQRKEAVDQLLWIAHDVATLAKAENTQDDTNIFLDCCAEELASSGEIGVERFEKARREDAEFQARHPDWHSNRDRKN
jgi:hypothetical protein